MEKIYKNMLYVLFVMALAMGLSSCGTDDDDPEDVSIVGTWHSSRTEFEDGESYSYNETLVFNKDHTGYTTIQVSLSSRASVTSTYTVHEEFSWTDNKTSDNIGYISFIHTSGDNVYGTGRYTYTLAGKTLYIAEVTFTK